MEVKKIDEQSKTALVELTIEDLTKPMETKEGPTVVEIEMADSEKWCEEGPIKTGQRVAHLIQTYPWTTEIVVRAGKTWILRQLVPLQHAIFPNGMPLDEATQKKIEESQDAAS